MPLVWKMVIVGAVAVSGVAIACIRRRPSRQGKPETDMSSHRAIRHTEKPRLPTDQEILAKFSVELRGCLRESGVAFPQNFTIDWLTNTLLGMVCKGDISLYQRFLNAIIDGSEGRFMPAARIGEVIDARRMIPGKELPAGYRVQKVVYSGLMLRVSGQVLVKAKVI